MRNLDRDLKLLVFGQDRAIETLVAAVRTARSGLRDPNRPVGCFLLAGPTGVGKTEVTRQLAILLGVELVRFDMSEYMERHTVSRLIGAPPGYVGFDQGGLLTEAINKHPHSVLLLDEIEKAHPDVFNVLLQVMDHGTLTDNNGRKADFRNVAVVMTTNAGAEQRHRRSMGFTPQDHSPDAMEAIAKTFSPEFRNRLDAVVEFDQIDRSVIGRIVDKFIFELENQLEEKRVTVELTAPAREWLAENGFDPAMGARPMARVIQEHVKRPLADELLFGCLADGGHVVIQAGEDGITLDCEPRQPSGRARNMERASGGRDGVAAGASRGLRLLPGTGARCGRDGGRYPGPGVDAPGRDRRPHPPRRPPSARGRRRPAGGSDLPGRTDLPPRRLRRDGPARRRTVLRTFRPGGAAKRSRPGFAPCSSRRWRET